MTDPVDPERPRTADPFDQPHGYSGQDYTIARERAEGERTTARSDSPQSDGRDIPPDAGHRAGAEPATGEVHGSGAGIGGSNAGEDFDSSTSSGDSYPITGGEGTDKTPGDLGPAQRESGPTDASRA